MLEPAKWANVMAVSAVMLMAVAHASGTGEWKKELKARLEAAYGPFVKMSKNGPTGRARSTRLPSEGFNRARPSTPPISC